MTFLTIIILVLGIWDFLPQCNSFSLLRPTLSSFTLSTSRAPISGHRHAKLPKSLARNAINEVNGESSVKGYTDQGDPIISDIGSGVLSPYQILHETSFSRRVSGIDRKLPLHECLDLLKNSLERIANGEVDPSKLLSDDTISSSSPSFAPTVVRLEHTVSSPIDPLCWLHAQTHAPTRIRGYRKTKRKDPTLYFANSENSLEVAVFGSAYSHKGAADKNLWNLVSDLPDGSRIYGGERFDQDTPHTGEEWNDFGKGLWILPAIELKTIPDTNGDGCMVTLGNGEHNYTPQGCLRTTTIAVHLHIDGLQSWQQAAQKSLQVLSQLSSSVSEALPTTTLPPIVSRDYSYGPDLDGQEIFERGVTQALEAFEGDKLEKVVLARRMELTFGPYAQLSGLDIVRRWRFGGHEGGHLLYLSPGNDGNDSGTKREFFGCTPERLFQIEDGLVSSEALAGTRPRGSTQEADAELLRDLFTSPKDRAENMITGRFIRSAFHELQERGLLETQLVAGDTDEAKGFFVRRLRHLQHICQRLEGKLTNRATAVDVAQALLKSLHPTPALNGFPLKEARQFIRDNESIGFDRGFYGGPFGAFGKDSADVVVAIRSGLLSKKPPNTFKDDIPKDTVSVFAGAGVVPGSTVQGEWSETSYKLGVIASLFPSSPITLKDAPNPNVAWATAFVEELVRCGVTQFYVCPGSRSTPLVAAIAKVVRSNLGVVHALSVHDERGAAFRALGWARGKAAPAAVITSSGTATGNLYPAIMEAGMDGVPMIVLTADRPYESRDTGANQALDQVKLYSSTYVRWFRDILPPSDDVPVSLALSDADQAVDLSRKLRGPVHVNIQFRENLAPDAGPIRNDGRIDSITNFNRFRFTDVPGFQRWSVGGSRWVKSFPNSRSDSSLNAAAEVAELILQSRRGLIVVGNIRASTENILEGDEVQVSDVISNFAQMIGFPIMAGVQSGSLRFRSPAVIPFAEHILKNPTVSENIKPDLIIQIGAPLISTEIPNVISNSLKAGEADELPGGLFHHILLHPHHPSERADPSFTVSHRISEEISPFLKSVLGELEEIGPSFVASSSELAPLVDLGRIVGEKMPEIIHSVSKDVVEESRQQCPVSMDDHSVVDDTKLNTFTKIPELTEPQIVLALAEAMSNDDSPASLFLSNSMPVRDGEFFLYPTKIQNSLGQKHSDHTKSCNVAVNRGASGIDGVISTAAGFAEASEKPTTLLVGDVTALHDINALHTLSSNKKSAHSSSHKTPSLTTVVVNNDGGGIFSFLPIAKHGQDVSFDEFFGTPTRSFSFQQGVEAFGLAYNFSSSFDMFKEVYQDALQNNQPCVIEAKVASREANVDVHRRISQRAVDVITNELNKDASNGREKLPIQFYSRSDLELDEQADDEMQQGSDDDKTLLLLHGWMGDKTEWNEVAMSLIQTLPPDWTILAIDLPGHGEAPQKRGTNIDALRSTLGIQAEGDDVDCNEFSIERMALSVLRSLANDYGLNSIDAVAGYSLGGRVALSMRQQSLDSKVWDGIPQLINEDTRMIMLGSYPGELQSARIEVTSEIPGVQSEVISARMEKDDDLSRRIEANCNRACLFRSTESENRLMWTDFLDTWYSIPSLWGNFDLDQPTLYRHMIAKRSSSLARRGRDIAAVLRQGSPSRHSTSDWKSTKPSGTLFVAGSLDVKYSKIGQAWSGLDTEMTYVEIPNAGHGLLVQAPEQVANVIGNFLSERQGKRKGIKITTKETRSTKASAPVEEKSTIEAIRATSKTSPVLVDDIVSNVQGINLKPSTDPLPLVGSVASIDFEMFHIDVVSDITGDKGVSGIGWGKKARFNDESKLTMRSGFIINLLSADSATAGLGEVSPLTGLHPESLEEAEKQLNYIKNQLERLDPTEIPKFDVAALLDMDGALADYMESLMDALKLNDLVLSVRSGLEMALISLAAQVVRVPIVQAITEDLEPTSLAQNTMLPVNGLITRGNVNESLKPNSISYPSLKVKIGHQSAKSDAVAIANAFDRMQNDKNLSGVRADANRAWDSESAEMFVDALNRFSFGTKLEFIEEPLAKVNTDGTEMWSFASQVEELEHWYAKTGIKYALDETLADLAEKHWYDFDSMEEEIRSVFSTKDSRIQGCAAFVLKPALLGLETSMRLARMARTDFSIGAVFSSSFDSGVGLAYTAFLAAASDMSPYASKEHSFPHGVGTFNMLGGDTLSPAFASYVNDQGMLKVASLSRALYGLSLVELRDSFVAALPKHTEGRIPEKTSTEQQAAAGEYQSSAATSSSGREISVVVSLPLPFSDEIACSRFTDLPQQPRWSPWLNSVAYLEGGRETEWTLNVRGVRFSWRAVSTILEEPYRGIRWESVSGLKNVGLIEFIPLTDDSCLMKVKMNILTPRVLAALFRGTSIFIEDFLQNKILKWSLEMFRDTVKGDLALERGDVELGDALFGAVEGRANAIEASLSASSPPSYPDEKSNPPVE